MKISNRVKELRKEFSLSLREVESQSGVALSSIRVIEIGQCNPRLDTLLGLRKAFGNVSLDYLVGLTDERETQTSPDCLVLKARIQEVLRSVK